MSRKLLSAAACAALLLAPGLARAQVIEMDCEILWTSQDSIGARQPITGRWIETSRMTLDIGAKSARVDYTLGDGSTGTVVRPLLFATATEAVLCQGEKCQDPIPVTGGHVRLSLTTINLVSGEYKRERYELVHTLLNNLSYVRDMKALGTCRRR